MRSLYVFGSKKATCKNCRKAEAIVEEILVGHEAEFDYRKLHLDSAEAEELGVLCTPTIVLDGQILVLGEVPAKGLLKEAILGT